MSLEEILVTHLQNAIVRKSTDAADAPSHAPFYSTHDDVRDFVPFDPAEVRIRPGRVRLPGLGWIAADVAPLPRHVRLTGVTLHDDGVGGRIVRIETDAMSG